MCSQDEVVTAIRSSFSRESSADQSQWSLENPALGQCEVASFVAWEHLGGELVLGRVVVDGVQTEHHYWNRVQGVDLDLSRDQFRGAEVIEELSTLDSATIRAQQGSIHPEMADRMVILRTAVAKLLGTPEGT